MALTSSSLTWAYFFRYASEGIKAACQWAYKGAPEDSVLEGKLQ